MVKGKLVEIKDLGMQVNKLKTNELVDLCVLGFETSDGKVYTYPLSKTCHASSKLGKFLRTLLGRNIDKTDYNDNMFDSSILIGTQVMLEIESEKIIGISPHNE